MTGQALQSPAVAGHAGAIAAAVGASSQSADEASPMQLDDEEAGQPVEPAAQRALPAALMVMLKKHSVVNLQDVRYAGSYCLVTIWFISMVNKHVFLPSFAKTATT